MFRKQFDRARKRIKAECADERVTIAEDLLTQRTLRKIFRILDDLEQVVEDTHAEDSEGADW